MESIITIGNKEVRMRVSARIPFDFRYKFGKDIIAEMSKLQNVASTGLTPDALATLEQLAWLLAKNAGEEVHQDLPPEEAVPAWLDEFDGMFDFIEAVPRIIGVWLENSRTQSTLVKK